MKRVLGKNLAALAARAAKAKPVDWLAKEHAKAVAEAESEEGRRIDRQRKEYVASELEAWGIPAREIALDAKLIPKRKYEVDVSVRSLRLAVDLQGAPGSGRHTHYEGYVKDREKARLLVLLGWVYLEFAGWDDLQRWARPHLEAAVELAKGRMGYE